MPQIPANNFKLYTFKVNSLGPALGPTFIISDNFGLTSPFEFTKQELLDGVLLKVNINATQLKVRSTGALCNTCNSDNIQTYNLPVLSVP